MLVPIETWFGADVVAPLPIAVELVKVAVAPAPTEGQGEVVKH